MKSYILLKSAGNPFYPNIHQFYTTQLAADMRVRFQGRQLDLIQVWNMTDFTRLQKNLIAHLITQKKT